MAYCKIIGSKVEEFARSPLIWNKLFTHFGISSEMRRLNLDNGDLFQEISKFLGTPEYRAILLAAPLKENAVRVLSENGLNICGELESINLIYKTSDGIKATSTDGFGAIASLNISSSPYVYMIFGNGGTSKSIRNAIFKTNSKSKVIVVTRQEIYNESRNEDLTFVTYESISEYLNNIDVVINATILGNSAHLNQSPIKFETFAKIKKSAKLLDVNYNDTGETAFINFGKSFGLFGLDGMQMNLMQALYAFKLSNPEVEKTLDELALLGPWSSVQK